MLENIISETMRFIFNSRPYKVHEFERFLKFEFVLKKISPYHLHEGFRRLKHLFSGKFAVRILFVPQGEMQVFIGDKEALAPIGQDDSNFILEIC